MKFIKSVNWNLIFSNKSVHKQVSIFKETLINIFSNFTPNKLVTCEVRDPLFLMNDKLVSNFKEKADHFNCFFAPHCTLLDNNSKILEDQTFITDNKLSSVQIEDNNIIKIIRSLNASKAHGHDDISTRILKLCSLAAVKTISIISRNGFNQSMFLDI